MKKIVALGFLLCVGSLCWGQETATYVVNGVGDACAMDGATYADLGAQYLCTRENIEFALHHTWTVGTYDHDGWINTALCEKSINYPYMNYVISEVDASTCVCDHWYYPQSTITVQNGCGFSPQYTFWHMTAERCTN